MCDDGEKEILNLDNKDWNFVKGVGLVPMIYFLRSTN
jgi:hypothetical protein